MKVSQHQNLATLDLIVVRWIGEFKRQDSKIDQILPVDAGKPASKHDAKAEIARRERGMFTARPLPIVAASYDSMTVGARQRFCSLAVGLVHHVEGEFGDFRNVTPVRQHSRPGR